MLLLLLLLLLPLFEVVGEKKHFSYGFFAGLGSILDTVSKDTEDTALSSILDTFSANFY